MDSKLLTKYNTAAKIWYDELQELKAVWMEHKQTIEEEYELDRKTRPSTASSSKKKK